jgi:hypothetical protein
MGSRSGTASAGAWVSASKYLGCKGAEAGEASDAELSADLFLRLKRSLIHLRMFGL